MAKGLEVKRQSSAKLSAILTVEPLTRQQNAVV